MAASSLIAFKTVTWKDERQLVSHLPPSDGRPPRASTDQDLLSGLVLVLDVLPQVSVGDLQILPHLAVVVEEGQVAIRDPDQLREEATSADSDWSSPFTD